MIEVPREFYNANDGSTSANCPDCGEYNKDISVGNIMESEAPVMHHCEKCDTPIMVVKGKVNTEAVEEVKKWVLEHFW